MAKMQEAATSDRQFGVNVDFSASIYECSYSVVFFEFLLVIASFIERKFDSCQLAGKQETFLLVTKRKRFLPTFYGFLDREFQQESREFDCLSTVLG